MASVLLPLAEGFEELEAVALCDVMRRGGINVQLAYIDELHGELVTGANGITIKADIPINNVIVEDFDMIVLPGGWGGTYALAESPRVQELLKEFKEKKIVGAMCAAPYALKKAGVLGERYTAYPGAIEEIDHPGYISDQKVVEDDNIITSQGPGTSVCFGLVIVKRLVGEETAQQVKEGMLLGYC
ncbi:MAG: DJ-1/PfpI family protein [Sulfurovum sp.]|nr:DJ-1/PfpI family protein [Sulfurovum sp.]MCB4751143.1 DJ-1/PfpI family protein [Sulfurovum sp.]MCB4762116.1 DJ-1/PfpI family protein [Sulfurovum sp.]MCB4777051.1 DJ-1/PfpI family protein [Sulfurovum sp.]MCB4784395.1 DJ-1/PfpI family protein [Sulfurovum sp.]